MRHVLLFLTVFAVALGGIAAPPVPAPKLLIAFASVRERRAPPYPKVYFYEHDGVGDGKLAGSIDSITKGTNNTRSDMHPSLSADGRLCAFSAQFGVTTGARIEVWDRKEKKLVPTALNDVGDIHRMSPSLSGDGSRVVFTAWGHPGGAPRWGVYLYDLAGKKFLDLPRLNAEGGDPRSCAQSSDGRVLAYVSTARRGVSLADIWLYDPGDKKIIAVPELNSTAAELQPSLSADGRLVAFSSERPDGKGGRDIYLFDRSEKKFLPLPGLNTEAHEQSPSLSADGRYLAFVSERIGGAGERDVYLYDRQAQKLLPTPGLNSKEDDYDPCVIVLPPQK